MRVNRIMGNRYDNDDAMDKPVEQKIFGGFYSSEDKKLLQKFQEGDWPVRQEIVDQFTDLRLRQLGRRVLAFYGPEALAEQSREQFRSKSGKSGIPPLKASLTGLRLRVHLLISKSYSKRTKLITTKELT